MVIIGIGARKSILFILPALCSTGITVVVIPLILLRGNLIDCYNKVGIEYVK